MVLHMSPYGSLYCSIPYTISILHLYMVHIICLYNTLYTTLYTVQYREKMPYMVPILLPYMVFIVGYPYMASILLPYGPL